MMNRPVSASTPVTSPTHPATPKVTEIPHQLSMRVTTLLKPSLFSTSPLAFESLPQGAQFSTDAVPRVEASSSPSTRPFAINYSGISELLQFTTGTEFFLSDSFTFYLHLSNDSEQPVTNVAATVIIKDPQSRNKIVLDTTSSPKAELKQQQSTDHIIKFNLTDPGYHVLGIQTGYTTHNGEARSLVKHFKFMVNKPISLESSLVTTLPTGYLVKVVATNLTTSASILMESVQFEPTTAELESRAAAPSAPSLAQSQSHSLSNLPMDLATEDILGLSNVSILRPGCSRQYIFNVDYVSPEKVNPKTISTLGSALAHWRFPMGEASTVASTPIFVNNSTRKPFTLIVSNIPSSIKINQAFSLSFLLHNISSAPIRTRLVAVKSKMEGITFTGLTGVLSPKLEPGESYTFVVKAVALEAGIQTLHGLRITELEKDKIYDLNNVLTVQVDE